VVDISRGRMSRKAFAITLLVGAFLTVFWTAICPTYKLAGQTTTIEQPPDPIPPNGYRHEGYWHPDAVTFTGGLVVIWSGVFGVALLLTGPGRMPAGAAPADEPSDFD
jgi:hypothetical protein